MGNVIKELAVNRHVSCFEEAHGPKASVVECFNRWLPGWNILSSVCRDSQDFEDPASGGVVIATCPDLSSICSVEFYEIVPGRCLSVLLFAHVPGLLRSLQVLTIHSYGLSIGQVALIGSHLDQVLEVCHRHLVRTSPTSSATSTFLLAMIEPLLLGDLVRKARLPQLATRGRGSGIGKSICCSGRKSGNLIPPTIIKLAMLVIGWIGLPFPAHIASF